MRIVAASAFGLAIVLAAGTVGATTLYSQDFENPAWVPGGNDWNNNGGTVTRVASGTGGIVSSGGSGHAVVSAAGPYTRFGGYNFGAGSVPTAFQEFKTSLDIYLNVSGGYANDRRFDYTSAVSGSDGLHRRDFVFSGGFYNDLGLGDRFIVSVSNNTPGWPTNPARNPFTISATGWYTFEHHMYDNGGVLAVDMRILDSSDNVLNTWTLSDPSDVIGVIGGSRYGWLVTNQLGSMAIDNASLERVEAIPLPSALLAGMGLLGGLGVCRRLRRPVGRG